MKKIITAVLLAMVLSVILTACENTESYMIVSPNDNTRGLDVVMERTTTGSAATGNLTINEGERVRYVSDMHDEDYTTETSYLHELETTREAWEEMYLTAYHVKNAISFPKPMDERTLEDAKESLANWCKKVERWEDAIHNCGKD